MCVSGDVKGITRYGVVSEKASVLARASFETPIKHIINAALTGEVDELNSVVENVMLNQPVPVGTGLPGLITKVTKKEK
jgi:DNA-directed RNA polymerase subunit A"